MPEAYPIRPRLGNRDIVIQSDAIRAASKSTSRTVPKVLEPPADPAHYPSWLTWLDTQRLTPLAYHWLLRTTPDIAIPLPIRRQLAVGYLKCQAEWLHIKNETITVLDILTEEPAIPVILLKGVALAESLYPDPALRPMGDIDVIVPAARMEEAARRLYQHGYARYGIEMAPGFNDAHLHHLGLVRTETAPPLRIELHTTFPWFARRHERTALAWFWHHTEPFTFEGRRTLLIDPTALMLQLSAHAIMQHSGEETRLIWFQDIDLLWRERGDDIIWDELVARAQAWGLEAAVHAALDHTVDYFATPMPPQVAAWLAHDPQSLSGAAVVRRLTAPGATRSVRATSAFSGKSPRQKLHYIVHIAAPQPSYMRDRYRLRHPALLPFAYLYRWLDIAGDLARTAWHQLRGLGAADSG